MEPSEIGDPPVQQRQKLGAHPRSVHQRQTDNHGFQADAHTHPQAELSRYLHPTREDPLHEQLSTVASEPSILMNVHSGLHT